MSDPTPPGWLKPINKLMIAVHRLGIPTGPVRVLTVVGRKSGQPRNAPVTPFTLDGTVYVAGGYPRADWVLNARAAGQGTVTRGRRSERVAFVELSAEDAKPVFSRVPPGSAQRRRLLQAGRARRRRHPR